METQFRDNEAVSWVSSLMKVEEVEANMLDLEEKWLLFGDDSPGEGLQTEKSMKDDNSPTYQLINPFELISPEGMWMNEDEYNSEKKGLDNLIHPNSQSIQLAVPPYILPSAEAGSQESCTSSVINIQFGKRWQAVVNLFSYDKALDRFDQVSDDATMKMRLWNLLISLPSQIEDLNSATATALSSFSSQSLSDAISSSKRMKSEVEDAPISWFPSSRIEAESKIHPSVKDYLIKMRGFLIIPPGIDIQTDRMFVRSKMNELIKKFGSLIDEITIFSPSLLLEQGNICLMDAPGDDDIDWSKGHQLVKAVNEADSVVIVSRRDIKSGVSLQTFAKLFASKLFDKSKNFQIYLCLREVPEQKFSFAQIQSLEQNRKTTEKATSLMQLSSSFAGVIKMMTNDKETRAKMEEMRKNMKAFGGYYFYIWPVLESIGNEKLSKQEIQFIEEESGYNDLIAFLTSFSTKQQVSSDAGRSWRESFLQLVQESKKSIEKGAGKICFEFIADALKGDEDPKLYYDFKNLLLEHPLFKRTVKDNSTDDISGFVTDDNKTCYQIAAAMSLKIENELRGENKTEYIQRINFEWTNQKKDEFLNKNSPDTPSKREFRLFPELIAPLIIPSEFEEFYYLLHENLLVEYMKIGNDAIKKHILKKYVEGAPWSQGIKTRSSLSKSSEAEKYSEKLKEGLVKDEKLKIIFDFITSSLESEYHMGAFHNKINGYLYTRDKSWMKETVVTESVKLNLKTYLYEELKNRIQNDIEGEKVLDDIIEIMSPQNIRDILIKSINQTFIEIFESLFKAFVNRGHKPILKSVLAEVFTKSPSTLSQQKKEYVLKVIGLIEAECNNVQSTGHASANT